jgi:hypothetical protein
MRAIEALIVAVLGLIAVRVVVTVAHAIPPAKEWDLVEYCL